ncbi:MalT transcriptional regulator family protein [Dethiobacter alkaliphilus]|uniref:Transcriptional regulator, LuxR family with TPR repeats n=1 Tax=Dethiobacter alkaliphilus AHT 1 TaxID=555088 RepID=C0GFG5_DETAL|nr:transcriptional regulator, LuxR family with TPR repeats [Dethiobacter alkaliphilus]EEG77925.1 transcriptional regulator, LuxR family with TPR repeats [Dethiobacter alkaliphilus AHT 1]
MVGNILKIKTSVPPQGANILPRPCILESLDHGLWAAEGFTYPLTLVSAPAGFGKTTLIRSWLTGREDRAAWYALDEADNKEDRFWLYLISSLQTLKADLGEGPMEMLRSNALSAESEDIESFLVTLLNELFALDKPYILVLDDYHLIENVRIHKNMAFFIENLPPTLHLAITTRSDPPWPLSRWRAKRKMAELRLDQLRFNEEETGRLLTETKGLALSEAQLNTLHEKTEGWIAGLQLAAYSLTSNNNKDRFIHEFAGNQRNVFNFLSEEVFTRQPEAVREFLMQTSILNRFCAPLCDAITGSNDSAEVLSALEAANLFVIPLDNQGIWYRYHHLFSDLLRHQLSSRQPEMITELHNKAGKWFFEANELSEAVYHFLTVKNLDKVAEILHANSKEIVESEGPNLIVRCLDSFPDEILRKYPLLAVYKALYHLMRKGREEVGALLALAEENADEKLKNHREYSSIVALVKAYHNLFSHKIPQALEHAQEALRLLPADNYFLRINIAIISGDTQLFLGDPKLPTPFILKPTKPAAR